MAGSSPAAVPARSGQISIAGPAISSTPSAANHTTKPAAVSIGLNSIVTAPSVAAVQPLVQLGGDGADQALPKLQAQDRLDALASLRASSAQRVALWQAGQPGGIVLSRDEAIARLQNQGGDRVVVAALQGKDAAECEQLVRRASAERVRAEWFTQSQTEESQARQAARAAQDEADRKTRREMSDTFYRALLGPSDGASTAAKSSEPGATRSGPATQPSR
jgi:hypothetical protein